MEGSSTHHYMPDGKDTIPSTSQHFKLYGRKGTKTKMGHRKDHRIVNLNKELNTPGRDSKIKTINLKLSLGFSPAQTEYLHLLMHWSVKN